MTFKFDENIVFLPPDSSWRMYFDREEVCLNLYTEDIDRMTDRFYGNYDIWRYGTEYHNGYSTHPYELMLQEVFKLMAEHEEYIDMDLVECGVLEALDSQKSAAGTEE